MWSGSRGLFERGETETRSSNPPAVFLHFATCHDECHATIIYECIVHATMIYDKNRYFKREKFLSGCATPYLAS